MTTNKVTYRQQYTRCGKERCRKCREGSGHGPYWYAYWSEKGRTVSKYIGTNLPEHLVTPPDVGDNLAPSLETSAPSQDTPILRIYMLGQFRIEHRKGTNPSHGAWQVADSRTSHRRRSRALLGCLLSSPSRRLPREQVMEMLWPDLDINLAANRLNGAVHELRQILEPDISRPSSSRLLRLERDILELADKTLIWVDAEAFEQLLKDTEMCIDIRKAERILEEAAALYQGNYLPEELYSEWAVPRRDALQRAWFDLQLRLTQIKVEQGAYVSAIEILDRLRTADPTNETALQQLMTLLTYLDRRAEALQIYKQYRAMLKRDYENQPLAKTAELYDKLRRGHVPPLSSIVGAGSAQGTIPTASNTSGVSNALPVEQEETDDTLSYTRPVFQLGHQNQSPLIGREREQRAMRQLLLTIEQQTSPKTNMSLPSLSPTISSRPRHSHFLLLRGEPGIGKTRMVEELSLEAYNRGWTVAWSRSYEQEGSIPHYSWTQLLRTLLGQGQAQQLQTFPELVTTFAVDTGQAQGKGTVGTGLAPVREASPALSTPPTPGILHKQERLHLWEATFSLLTTLSKFHPLLLVFDDLHWADDNSIELLTYITRHLQGQRVLLIGTCRDSELAPQHKLRSLATELQREQAITMISAQPLTQSQIGTLISHLPEKLVSSIQTQSSGNPFFAEELARTNSPVGAELAPALPDAIVAILERRLHLLSNECRTLLSRATVLGDSFKLEQLLPMAPEHNEDVILDFLEEALHAGLLTEEETEKHVIYHFWHPLTVSYLYNRLSAARRAQLHRRADAHSATSQSDTPESNHSARNRN